MRLSKIIIRNFKGMREVTVCIPKTDSLRRGSGEFVSIVGPNNVGKSSVMDAIALACPGETSQATIDLFPFRDEGRGPISVEFEFDDISDAEQEEEGLARYVIQGRIRARKTWHGCGPGKKPECEWFASPSLGIDWATKKISKASLKSDDALRAVCSLYETRNGPLPQRQSNKINAALDAIAKEINSPLLVKRDGGWEKQPATLNLDAVLPRVIRILAVRDAREETESGKKQSTIRKLVTEMFRDQLESDPALAQFRKASKDIERMFASNNKNPIVIELEEKITRHLQDIISIRANLGFAPLDINALSTDLASRTELWIREIWAGNASAPETKPEHQGHGAQRALIVSLLQLLAEQLKESGTPATKLLFLVDEPEIYLHPEMCRRIQHLHAFRCSVAHAS